MITRIITNQDDPLLRGDGALAAFCSLRWYLVTPEGQPTDGWDAITGERILPGPVPGSTDGSGIFSQPLWPTSRSAVPLCWRCEVDSPFVTPVTAPLPDGPGPIQWAEWKNAGQVVALPDYAQQALDAHTGDAALHLNWRGPWDVATPYQGYDAVSHNGSSWKARQDSTGQAPEEGVYWTVMAAGVDVEVLTVNSALKRVGIGTSTPMELLDIYASSTPTVFFSTASSSNGSITGRIDFKHTAVWNTNKTARIESTMPGSINGHPYGTLGFYTSNNGGLAQRVMIDANGNLGLGQTTFGTSAAKVLALGSGTAPTSSPADAVQLWSADTNGQSGRSGLHLRTEDGTSHVWGNYVGIGTTTPTAMVQVSSADPRVEITNTDGNGDHRLTFRNSSGTVGFRVSGGLFNGLYLSTSTTGKSIGLAPNNTLALFCGDNGGVNIGGGQDTASAKLVVAGSVRASRYRLDALDTAPASATAAGTAGEIRITATHIYVCIATNTWVRSPLTTW